MMNKLFCYNRWQFEEVCKGNGWDDEFIPPKTAFISICGSKECQEFVLQEREFHYFEKQHPQVLNLEFDDITDNVLEIPNHPKKYFYGMTIDQGKIAAEFIQENLGSDFYIHCRAGQSRSQAFVRYMLDMYDGIFDFMTRPENPPINYNRYVLSELKMGAKLTGEYWRCCFIHNGYTVTEVEKERGLLGATIIRIHTKEVPGYVICCHDSGCSIVGNGVALNIDELGLFEELEKLKNLPRL